MPRVATGSMPRNEEASSSLRAVPPRPYRVVRVVAVLPDTAGAAAVRLERH